MITWKRWMFRRGDLQVYVFRPTWHAITIPGIEATFLWAVGPFHGGVWWRRP